MTFNLGDIVYLKHINNYGVLIDIRDHELYAFPYLVYRFCDSNKDYYKELEFEIVP